MQSYILDKTQVFHSGTWLTQQRIGSNNFVVSETQRNYTGISSGGFFSSAQILYSNASPKSADWDEMSSLSVAIRPPLLICLVNL
jgi:hypothetical protein